MLIGSGEIYGLPDRLPVDEDAPLRPQNPYAVSKAACDLLGGQYADATGLRVVRLRPFNHGGPGQSDDYVVGTLTRQVAEAEAAAWTRRWCAQATPTRARLLRRPRRGARLRRGRGPGPGRLQRGQRPGGQRARADRSGAGGGPIPVRHELDPAASASTTYPRCGLGRAAARCHRLDARDPARPDGGGRARGLAGGARGHAVTAAFAVVVVTHDSAAHVAKTLGALAPQLRSDDELIVVDNGSRDGTVDVVRRAAPGLDRRAGQPRVRRRRHGPAEHAHAPLLLFLTPTPGRRRAVWTSSGAPRTRSRRGVPGRRS